MNRSLCCAAALAVLVTGNAQATTWNFTYTGFYDAGPSTWLPDYSLSGSFTGNDNDGNGIIALGELTRFDIGGYGLIYNGALECHYPPVGMKCSVDTFNYHLTGTLVFDAFRSYSDERGGSYNRWVSDYRMQSDYFDLSGTRRRTLYWQDATTFSISPPPIPEPSIASLAAAGTLLLIGKDLYRRRKGRSTPAAGLQRI